MAIVLVLLLVKYLEVVMIRNFRPVDGKKDFAIVECSVFGLFKRDRRVYRERYSIFWRWLDNGKYTPSSTIEELASKYYAEIELNK